jgi:ribosomal protein S18 acetylase RimI-like enzyme
LLEKNDLPEIAKAFQALGWNKPASQYERYLIEQSRGLRNVFVAFVGGEFSGYLTICWQSLYEAFRKEAIPEIVDFNVLPKFRRQGIGTQLMDVAENSIVKVNPVAGIGVGLDPDFGAAQRLYILRGYIPDGRGLHYRDHYVKYGEQVTIDYDLTLYLTKELK